MADDLTVTKREGTQLLARGGVKIVVLAPCVCALSIPFVALLRSLTPLAIGLVAAGLVICHGVVDIVRGVSRHREAARLEAGLPPARLLR